MPRPVWLDAWLLPRREQADVEGLREMMGTMGSDGRRRVRAGLGALVGALVGALMAGKQGDFQ